MTKTYDLTYISLGGGRQSTALALCSAKGLHGIPKADCAIFADTDGEVWDTYEHLGRMRTILENSGIQFHVVRQGNLGEELVGQNARGRSGFIVSIPAFSQGAEREGMLQRQCTKEYKILPIQRKVRELLGFKKGEVIAGKKMVRAFIGISTDEVIRAKTSREAWIENCYPLLDARLNVRDCEKICKDQLGYTPIKSACRFCPYHDDSYWNWLKTNRPDEFEKACQTDEGIRNLTRSGVKKPVFLHRSRTPLRGVDFDKDKDQMFLNGFGNECEGVCGV